MSAVWLMCVGCAGKLDEGLDYYARPAAARSADAAAPRWQPDAAAQTQPDAGWASELDEDAGGAAPVAAQPHEAGPSCDFRALIQAKCGNAACHGAPAMQTGLDLSSPGLAQRVQDRMGQGACADHLLVDRDDPRDSKLYLKVSGTSCGATMPVGGTLSADEQACVLNWIEQLQLNP